MTHADVLIVGGSLGGLMAANLLLRAGVNTLVLEKSPVHLDGRGAGIVTHSALFDTLRSCGVVVDESLGVRVAERVTLGRDGAQLSRQVYPQVLTSWARLYKLLIDALPAQHYVLNAGVTSVINHASGTTVQCEDGRSFSAPIAIGADGIRSAVRAQYAPQIKPVYAGYVAWRGVCDEASLSQRTRDTLFGYFGFGLPEHEQMLGYPVAGPENDTRVGKRCYNFVWYRPAHGATLQALLTDADGKLHEGGIAPQKIDWRQVAAVRQAAQDLLAPQFAEVLQKTAQPFLQPIVDVNSQGLAFDRVALLGDAAFVARPHVGMGVTKAAEDALALAKAIALEGATPSALQRYESNRLGIGRSVVERGRMLGAYMESQTLSTRIERSAEKVMRETAIDLSLH
jgi:2-polyprenyl-6-methoxyphenol hydroxylase-like FAD-dependent oxidoreductase